MSADDEGWRLPKELVGGLGDCELVLVVTERIHFLVSDPWADDHGLWGFDDRDKNLKFWPWSSIQRVDVRRTR